MSAQHSTADLILQGLGVVATFAVVVVALFGDKWRARLFPVKLRVARDDHRGKLLPGKAGPRRWFQVRVSNEQRWQKATDVSVVLLKVEILDGTTTEPDSTCDGAVAMRRSE